MIQKIKNLLFENTSIKQTIAKNTFWVGLAQAFAVLGKTGFIIYVARFSAYTCLYGFIGIFYAYFGGTQHLQYLAISDICPGSWRALVYPSNLDGSKITKLGFKYKYNSTQTFLAK